MNSSHRVEIVPVELRPHGNADSLSVVPVFGYSYVGRTKDWEGVKKGAYVPPDSLVDVARPEFAFLAAEAKADGMARIKAKKLRGVVSFGLLVPVPDDAEIGDDWAERLGVLHYEPPLARERGALSLGGEEAPPPNVASVKYDLEAFRRHASLFRDGEPVLVLEKVDGANARYVFHDGRMHCGSRNLWKREFPNIDHVTPAFLADQGVDPERAAVIVERLRSSPPKRNLWWDVLSRTPALEKFCRDNPGVVVYGEVFGNVNCIKYGLSKDEFVAFDLLRDGRWVDGPRMIDELLGAGAPVAPRVFNGAVPFDFDAIANAAEGPTLVPGARQGTIREGVVVSPVRERWDERHGRVKLKCVSGAYLEKYR